jgi:hypothetical protein
MSDPTPEVAWPLQFLNEDTPREANPLHMPIVDIKEMTGGK